LIEKRDVIDITRQDRTGGQDHAASVGNVGRDGFDGIGMSLAWIARTKHQLGTNLDPLAGTLGQNRSVGTLLKLIERFE